jgi:hypothetical protein
MKTRLVSPIPLPLLLVTLAFGPPAGLDAAPGAGLDTAHIERLTGLKGAWNEGEGVFKVSAPRADVKVAVDGWPAPPFMGLTSWAAFASGKGAEAMVMGDLVLFQDEVNPVMSAALDGGLNVTALHNHFFFDEPKVYFMHIGGEGSLARLAGAVGDALRKVREIRAQNSHPATTFGGSVPAQNTINGPALEAILGVKGQTNNGMFKVVVGRKAKMPCGCEVTKEMGVNTWAAFAGTDDNAIVDGDFAVHEDELQEVLKALRRGSINIVAIHHHMIEESPRTLFLHYWGRGKAADLGRTLKSALSLQKP